MVASSPTQIKSSPSLTNQELYSARLKLIIRHQKLYFESELQRLSQNKPVSLKSPIMRLAPYLDKERVIRVGGRLHNARLSEESKHPIILHKKSHLVSILLNDLHHLHHHASARVLMALTAGQYYISGLRSLARRTAHNCVP